MELYQLKSFLTIAHEKNLTRAAASLHLSQSALSNQIKLLEEELGVHLFTRTSRGMKLTDQGQILSAHAQEVLERAVELQQRAAALSRGISETVSIGLNTDPAFLRVSAINKRLGLLHSDTNVIFHGCPSTDTPQRLRRGQIDLGFFYGDRQPDDIMLKDLCKVRTCVVIPKGLDAKGFELEWPDVAALPWVWVDSNFPFFKSLQHKLQDYKTIPNQAVTAADEQIVRELVADSQGVAIMREDEARPLVDKDLVTIWPWGWGETSLSLAWMKERGTEKCVKAALDAVTYVWHETESDTDGSMQDKCWV